MIPQILDLHIHSRFSRACSKDLTLPNIAAAAQIRGITLLSTGDFTHPGWFEHLRETLVETSAGVYQLKGSEIPTRFILGTEIASIKKHKDKVRRIHHLLFAPNLEVVEIFNKKLVDHGCNIRSDGRPILGLTSKEILTLMLETDERMMMIPAHAWTPWFGIFGSKGGYDSLIEAYDDLAPHIRAIETGLSSDPLMNWRVGAVDNLTLISNSDAHSAAKLGREANVFQFDREADITYDEIRRIITEGDRKKFLYTIEFYPEEGKYHYDGHADCLFSCPPTETKKYGGLCPKCGKALVIGVMNRIEELAVRTPDEAKKRSHIPYKNLVPLPEIIADTLGVGVASKAVQQCYQRLIKNIGNEFSILLDADLVNIEAASSPDIARAVDRVRRGDIYIKPGYDGIFGTVKVFAEDEGKKVQQQMLGLG